MEFCSAWCGCDSSFDGTGTNQVSSCGGSFLTNGIADTALSNLRFDDESRAHVFVSWLHPFRALGLVVVGDKKMAIFNDVAPFGEKLQCTRKMSSLGAITLAKKAADFLSMPIRNHSVKNANISRSVPNLEHNP